MQTAPRDSGHIRALDGIRGLAILLVYAYHAFSRSILNTSPAMSLLTNLTSAGWVGVDLFFVLSGFLITTILLDAQHTSNYFKVFYARRALRIFPVYYVVLIGVFFFVPGHYPHKQQLFYWLNLSNLPTAFGQILTVYLTHLWSLGIEEQFYMFWPSIVRWCRVRTVAYLCVATIVGVFVVRNLPIVLHWNGQFPELIYRFTLFRIDTLCAGALLAIVVKYRPRQIENRIVLRIVFLLSLAVFLGCGRSYNELAVIRFGYTALVSCFTSLIALALFPGGWTSRLFSNRGLRWMGKYSYSFYLFHPFVLNPALAYTLPLSNYLVSHHLLPNGLSTNTRTILFAVLAFAVIVALSAISWSFFEGPILKYKKHFRYSPKLEHHLA